MTLAGAKTCRGTGDPAGGGDGLVKGVTSGVGDGLAAGDGLVAEVEAGAGLVLATEVDFAHPGSRITAATIRAMTIAFIQISTKRCAI
jgi:hypothetical protein